MTDDPKKDNEIKDEDLKKVAGGVGGPDIDRPDDSGGSTTTDPTVGKQRTEKI